MLGDEPQHVICYAQRPQRNVSKNMLQVCWKRMRNLRAVFEGLARGHPDNVYLRHLLLARCSLTTEVTGSQHTLHVAQLFPVLTSLQYAHFMNVRGYSKSLGKPVVWVCRRCRWCPGVLQ